VVKCNLTMRYYTEITLWI